MTSTREMLTLHVEMTIACLTDVWEAIDNGDEYDGQDPYDYLHEWPLEIVDERGRQFAVVFATGGPHIELVADGLNRAYMCGMWGGEKVERYGVGDVLDRTLDYFIER